MIAFLEHDEEKKTAAPAGYVSELTRIKSGDELTGIANAITEKYPSRTTRDAIEAGDVWLFEAQPVN